MKRYITIITLILCFGVGAEAQDEKKVQQSEQTEQQGDLEKNGGKYKFSFLRGKTMPDMMSFLQGPPERGSYLWKNDSVMYEWGKTQRETLRGDTARMDANVDIDFFFQRFGKAMHKRIDKEDCPKLTKLVSGVIKDMSRSIDMVKRKVARHRPYQVFGEPTSIPEDEYEHDFTSYPSGHSVRAWGLALTFVALDPEHQDEILKTGYDMCESRVIAGYHFESDVEAARLAASATFARLCAEEDFLKALKHAKEELEDIDD